MVVGWLVLWPSRYSVNLTTERAPTPYPRSAESLRRRSDVQAAGLGVGRRSGRGPQSPAGSGLRRLSGFHLAVNDWE